MSVLAALKVVLGLDTGPFQKGADQAQREAQKLVKSVRETGLKMAALGAGITASISVPFVEFVKSSLPAAKQSAEALGQVNAALASMGPVAGKTTEELQRQAAALMNISTFDDDDIMRSITANMLTFGNISGEAFDRAQLAAVNLSARLGQDLQSSAIQLGKALNDPVKGVTALAKVGVSFTTQQKDQIKAMVKAGDVAGAQSMILKELEKQYGGAAKALRDAAPETGVIQAWDSIKEVIGEIARNILPRILPPIERLLQAFLDLDPRVQTIAVGFVAAAAAAGPLLIGAGAMVTAFAGLAPVMGAVAAALPVIAAGAAIVAGVGALIYSNWEKIAPVLQEIWEVIQTNLGPPARELIDALGKAFGDLSSGPMGPLLHGAIEVVQSLASAIGKAMGPTTVGAVKAATTVIGALLHGMAATVNGLVAVFNGTFALGVAQAMRRLYEGVREWLVGKLDNVWEWVRTKIVTVRDAFYNLYDAVVGHSYIPDMVDGIAAQMNRLDGVMVAPADKATKKTAEAFKNLADEVQPLLDRLFPEARALNDWRKDLATLDQAEKAKMLDPAQAAEARRRLNQNAVQGSLDAGAGAIGDLVSGAFGKVQESFSGVTEGMEDVRGRLIEANKKIGQSFTDMAQEAVRAIGTLGHAIKDGDFFDILDAVVGLGLQLGGMGVFGKSAAAAINGARVPGYAGGTRWHPGGLAVVGERGPELVNLPRGASVTPNGAWGGGGGGRMEVEVLPSEYFDVRVRRHISDAAPGIAQAGAQGGANMIMRRQARSLRG